MFCDGQWNYHFNICENVNLLPPPPPLRLRVSLRPWLWPGCWQVNLIPGIGCSSTARTAAFRIDEYTACPPSTSCECEILGPDVSGSSSVTVTAIDGESDSGVELVFTYLTRTLTLELLCDSSGSSEPDPVTEASTSVTMTWRTPLVCAGGAGGGTGWLIVICTGVAAGGYVFGGIGYASRTNTSGGLAAHPHQEQWTQLPGLISDGFLFTKAKLVRLGLGCLPRPGI